MVEIEKVMSKTKIYFGPQEIAGYYANLEQGFGHLGIQTDYFPFSRHKNQYETKKKMPFLLNLSQRIEALGQSYFGKFETFFIRPIVSLLRYIWAIHAIFYYDVFVFGFGRSFFIRNLDMYLIRFLGKRIISNLAHGSEVRAGYCDGFYALQDNQHKTRILKNISVHNKKSYTRHEKLSSVIIGAPFSNSTFGQIKFVNSFMLGIPFSGASKHQSTNEERIKSEANTNSTVRILHSPSNPIAKGSYDIKKATDNLIKKGYDIELIIINGKPYAEVLSAITGCDFVVDQLYSDTPMAGFATEAAWFGKPAVVGGYGLEHLKEFVPSEMWPPSKICLPHEIESAIEELIRNKEQRKELGEAAMRFVHEKWNAKAVAARYLRIINNDIPDLWWINPKEVVYLEGAGQAVEVTKRNVQELVNAYGEKALMLDHRPDLLSAFLEFAGVKAKSIK